MIRYRNLLALWLLPAAAVAQNPEMRPVDGRTLFEVSCSRCHGMRGGGGEGPTLTRLVLPRAPDDDALYSVRHWAEAAFSGPDPAGIPNTEMG